MAKASLNWLEAQLQLPRRRTDCVRVVWLDVGGVIYR
jgi:hypothetical protein